MIRKTFNLEEKVRTLDELYHWSGASAVTCHYGVYDNTICTIKLKSESIGKAFSEPTISMITVHPKLQQNPEVC